MTVTAKVQVAVAPPALVATQVTVVAPIGKLEPLAGEQTVNAGQLPAAGGTTQVTTAPQEPGSLS